MVLAKYSISAALGCLVALGIFVLIMAAPIRPQVFDNYPLVGRLWVDKTIIHIGDTVYLRHEYYNPNPFSVTFTPPRIVKFSDGFVGEEKSWHSYTVSYLDQPDYEITIPPFGTYYPTEYEMGFSVAKVGFFELIFMDSIVEVKIIP